ncbi:MAG: citrate/2-methylcitrate synthase, partial [Eubacteriales bacterium]
MINYSEVTPYIRSLAELSDRNNHIVPQMYAEHDVKRGLRDINGDGVVAGLTEVSRIKAKEIGANGEEIPCEGQLYYRGINIQDLVRGFLEDNRPGFEETVYLLLFSELPTKREL